MIKNIVFDLGRVLLSYEPRDYVENLYGPGEKAEALLKAVFGSEYWLNLDQGILGEEAAIEKMAALADYPEEIRYLIYHWDTMLIPLEPSLEVLRKLKEQDYALYLLSNFHKRAYANVSERYSFFRMFHGIVVSADVQLLKPDMAIYRRLLRDFLLSPEECLFVDDTPRNVNAAKEVGMEGILFREPAQLEKELSTFGIKV